MCVFRSLLNFAGHLTNEDPLILDDVVINDVAANQAGIDSVVAEIKTLGRKSFGIVCGSASPFPPSKELPAL